MHRLARFEEPALCGVQLLVCGQLFGLKARDRLACLFLPRILRSEFLFSRSAFGGNLILLSSDPHDRFRAGRDLQVEANARLLEPVSLSLQRQNRGFETGNRNVKRCGFHSQVFDRRSFSLDAISKLLDLATGGQNPARFGTRAALDHVRPTEDLAFDGDNRSGRGFGGGQRSLVPRSNPGGRDGTANGRRRRTVDLDDIEKRRQVA